MNHWWVNQNQTYQHEVHGGYLWSPKTNKNGARNRFYDAMTEVATGDVVFSFADTYIKAIGIVSGPHQSAAKPSEFGAAGANWANEGWYVPVVFEELARPARPKDHIDQLRPVLPSKYSPLQSSGDGNQGVYLAPVPTALADKLIDMLGGQIQAILANATSSAEADDSAAIVGLVDSRTTNATQRAQLIQARIGQGLFRSRVVEIEPRCRITDTDDPRFLVASHIKPWSKSDDYEKLDGQNGLLLAPHVDHLFDKGFITFQDDGRIIISPQLPIDLWKTWALPTSALNKPFNGIQRAYIAYHRENVFRK